MVSIAICDDEEYMMMQLSSILSECMNQRKIKFQLYQFYSGEELLKCNKRFDCIFLDIQMKELNGIETAKKLREKMSDSIIIFVTILKEYALEAFDVEAFSYLLKPVSIEKINQIVDRVMKNIVQKDFLVIQKGIYCRKVEFSSIYYCEVIKRKIFVHTEKEIIDYYNKFEELENELSSDFFCCHRSYLVNLAYVSRFDHTTVYLKNGEGIPMSRLRIQQFSKALIEYLKYKR